MFSCLANVASPNFEGGKKRVWSQQLVISRLYCIQRLTHLTCFVCFKGMFCFLALLSLGVSAHFAFRRTLIAVITVWKTFANSRPPSFDELHTKCSTLEPACNVHGCKVFSDVMSICGCSQPKSAIVGYNPDVRLAPSWLIFLWTKR